MPTICTGSHGINSIRFDSIRRSTRLLKGIKKLDYSKSRQFQNSFNEANRHRQMESDRTRHVKVLFCSVLFCFVHLSQSFAVIIARRLVLNSTTLSNLEYSTLYSTRYPVLCTSIWPSFPHCSFEFRSDACGAPLCKCGTVQKLQIEIPYCPCPATRFTPIYRSISATAVCPLPLNHSA